MKTISQSNAKKRLFKIVDAKRLNKRSREFKLVADAINEKRKRIDTVWTTGSSWKYSTLINETKTVSSILTQIGIEFKVQKRRPPVDGKNRRAFGFNYQNQSYKRVRED